VSLHGLLRIACLSFLSLSTVAARAQSPDIILHHGHIFTGDIATPWVEAVSVRGNTVLAVGSESAILATADKHTRVIDLQGRMAMAGINDAHDHVGGAPYGVEAATKTPPAAHPSLAELAEAVRAAAATAPPGVWIHAMIGSPVITSPKLTRAAIDEAGGNHPVILQSWVGHGAIVNAFGLAKLGINDSTPDPPGGHYDRDSDGHLTGKLEEYAGDAIWMRLADQPGVPAAVNAFRPYAVRRLSQGVTTVQVMGTNQRLAHLQQTFVEADEPIRLRIMRFPIPAEDALNGDHFDSGEKVLTPLIRVAGIKWVLDGTPIDDQLAFQTKDYPGRPGWRGRPNFNVDFIDTQLRLALTGKDQLMLHVVGDAMTDEVMDEMEKLAPPDRWRPLRLRFEHGDGLTTPERLQRAHNLGIVVAQPRPGRNFRAFLDAGIPLAYGSDQGMAPFFMFSVMTAPGDPKAISRVEALAVLTSGPAFAEFQESRKGRLAAGMLADITVLSQDVMTAAQEDIVKTQSLLTLVNGKLAYSSEPFSGGESAAVPDRH
jgi:predicted amidohydrolase YtcJ